MHDGLQFDRRHVFDRSIRLFGLVEVTREAIEHIAAMRVASISGFAKHLKDEVVRNQIPSPNVLDRLSSYFGVCCNLPAQQLSAREVRDPIVLGKLGRLRSLARTGWGNQQQTHGAEVTGRAA